MIVWEILSSFCENKKKNCVGGFWRCIQKYFPRSAWKNSNQHLSGDGGAAWLTGVLLSTESWK